MATLEADQLPEVPDDGLLVKTLYVGICHVETDETTGEPTLIEGHNVCAKVLAIGGNVPAGDCDIRVGDVVVLYPWPGCGHCETCSAGSSHLCDEDDVVAQKSPRTLSRSHSNVDVGKDKQSPFSGRFANFQVIPDWQHAVRLPREIQPQVGCQLPCGVLRVYVAMLDAKPSLQQAIRIRGFANLLIVCGDRADGLVSWCIQMMKSVFCDRNVKVVCVGPRRDILDLAVESGADDAVHLEHPQVSSSTTAAAVTDVDASIMTQLIDRITMSGYNRMDVAIDLVGDPPSFAIAVRSLHRGGTVFELGARHRPPPPSVGTGNFLSPQTVGSPSSSSTAAAAAAAGAATTTTVQLSELVSRSVSLRPVAAGSTPLLRQLVDVLSVQQIGVDAISVEVFQPDQLKSAIDRYERRLAAGPILIKYE